MVILITDNCAPDCTPYNAQMASRISSDERNEFSQRLNDALSAAGYQLSPTVLAREFNPRADGAAVTVHGARKWLMGEAIPTQDRIHVLSRWLGVAAQWLRYGDGDISESAANDPMRLPLEDVMLLNESTALMSALRQLFATSLRRC